MHLSLQFLAAEFFFLNTRRVGAIFFSKFENKNFRIFSRTHTTTKPKKILFRSNFFENLPTNTRARNGHRKTRHATDALPDEKDPSEFLPARYQRADKYKTNSWRNQCYRVRFRKIFDFTKNGALEGGKGILRGEGARRPKLFFLNGLCESQEETFLTSEENLKGSWEKFEGNMKKIQETI